MSTNYRQFLNDSVFAYNDIFLGKTSAEIKNISAEELSNEYWGMIVKQWNEWNVRDNEDRELPIDENDLIRYAEEELEEWRIRQNKEADDFFTKAFIKTGMMASDDSDVDKIWAILLHMVKSGCFTKEYPYIEVFDEIIRTCCTIHGHELSKKDLVEWYERMDECDDYE